MGIANPTDRSFVVEDTEKGSMIVGFSRWMVPQNDGNLERKWPDCKEDQWDMEVAGAFFGGSKKIVLQALRSSSLIKDSGGE